MKKNVMRLEGQTQLSFASQRQEQEGQEPATVIEKDDATTTAQAKSKERKLFEPWLKKKVDGLRKKWQLHVLPSLHRDKEI